MGITGFYSWITTNYPGAFINGVNSATNGVNLATKPMFFNHIYIDLNYIVIKVYVFRADEYQLQEFDESLTSSFHPGPRIHSQYDSSYSSEYYIEHPPPSD